MIFSLVATSINIDALFRDLVLLYWTADSNWFSSCSR